MEEARNKINCLESGFGKMENEKGALEKRVSQCLVEIQVMPNTGNTNYRYNTQYRYNTNTGIMANKGST